MKSVTQRTRFINFIIDTTVVFLLAFLLFYIFSFSYIRFELSDVLGEGELFRLDYLLIIVTFCYYFILESIFGKTIGKLITKTKVISIKGREPSIIAIFVRTILRLIPFDIFSYLFSPIGWHDKYSLTILTFKEELNPNAGTGL